MAKIPISCIKRLTRNYFNRKFSSGLQFLELSSFDCIFHNPLLSKLSSEEALFTGYIVINIQ